jgi:hypothetical protein
MRCLFVIIVFGLSTGNAFADRPKVTIEDGHIMPLEVLITFPSGNNLQGLLCSSYVAPVDNAKIDHKHEASSMDGGKVSLWWDTVAAIEDANSKDALFVFKNGQERRLGHNYPYLIIIDDIGIVDSIHFEKIKKVEFLKPPRKDGEGHAMFDHWRYSPYTGEKLPEN